MAKAPHPHPTSILLRGLVPTMLVCTGGIAAAESADDAIAAPLVVESEAEAGYRREQAPLTTRLPVPLAVSPISVQVVPRQVLVEQGALGLEDVYRNVSGVTESGNTLNAQSEVLPFIRGFEAPVMLRNGMRVQEVGAVDLVGIESVEVLKGPSSILFGALEPGGVVSYTTRRPEAEAAYEARIEAGSFDRLRGSLGATGGLDADGRLRYRVDAAYTDSGSFRDEIEIERLAVAPSLLWVPAEGSEFGIEASYSRETQPYDSGIPLDADGQPLVDESTFFGDPDLAGRELEDVFLAAHGSQVLTEALTLRGRIQFHRGTPTNESIRHRSVAGSPGAEQLRIRYQDEAREDRQWQGNLEMLADLQTGQVRHRAVIGVEYSRETSEFDRFRQNLPNVIISDDPNVNFDPPPHTLARSWDSERDWVAIYAHDHLSLLDDRLHILVGGRVDAVDQQDNLSGDSDDSTSVTGRFGVLYRVNDWFSPYASLSQSFSPQFLGTVDRDGDLLDPETGLQIEIGAKFELLDGALSATLALYQIDKEGVAVYDLDHFNNTGEDTYFPGVEQRSRGLELDVTGQITSELRVIANYAYTDTEETANAGDPDRVGQRLGNVPDHMLRLWAAYDLAQDHRWSGLGFGLGLRYESDRLAQFDADIELDAYVVFDAAIWYRHLLDGGQELEAVLNLTNLLDEDYIIRASDQSIAHPGAPLAVTASVGISF